MRTHRFHSTKLVRRIVPPAAQRSIGIAPISLITDHNTFRFPKASGGGTHPAGRFTVNPDTRPKQVDSIAEGGPNAAQLTRGITRSSTQPTNAPTGGPPGGPRPTEFKSPPGSGRILQYCKKIGPVPSR